VEALNQATAGLALKSRANAVGAFDANLRRQCRGPWVSGRKKRHKHAPAASGGRRSRAAACSCRSRWAPTACAGSPAQPPSLLQRGPVVDEMLSSITTTSAGAPMLECEVASHTRALQAVCHASVATGSLQLGDRGAHSVSEPHGEVTCLLPPPGRGYETRTSRHQMAALRCESAALADRPARVAAVRVAQTMRWLRVPLQ